MDISPTGPATPRALAGRDRDAAAARQAARAFESAFLAEMLKHTGVNAMPSGFGGGAGEEAFSSFLTEEYARLMAERGGVGIAERIFHMLNQGDGAK
jgi:Rod binding domain-containing protein